MAAIMLSHAHKPEICPRDAHTMKTDRRRTVLQRAAQIARYSRDCEMAFAYWADQKQSAKHRRLAIKRAYKSEFPASTDPLLLFHQWFTRLRLRRASPRQRVASKSKALRDSELFAFAMREARQLCLDRQRITGFRWQIDHMIPLRAVEATGLDVPANLQVIPARLNAAKSNRMIYTEPMEWMADA